MILFKNLPDLMRLDEQACRKHLEKILWGDTPICPHCKNVGAYTLKDGKTYKCNSNKCYKPFTVTKGTVFEHSPIKLNTWFAAIYLCTIHKKGISSRQLAVDLGVTQKTAWFMLHRIRHTFMQKNPFLLTTSVQIDETFVGGKNKNRHHDKKVQYGQGRSYKDKTPVLGMLQKGGALVTRVVQNTHTMTLMPLVRRFIKPGSTIYSDEWKAYNQLYKYYNHEKVFHASGQYINGEATTNAVENAWSHLKRSIIGIYHFVSRKHLQKYVDEFTYRLNVRKVSVQEQFYYVLLKSPGRLTYKDLISSHSFDHG